jgi:hypothetical protein
MHITGMLSTQTIFIALRPGGGGEISIKKIYQNQPTKSIENHKIFLGE